jgi:hypothetical protein
MGVNGFEFLDLAKRKRIIPVMLTARALSVESPVKSFKKGAVLVLPVDEMHNIAARLTDMLRASMLVKMKNGAVLKQIIEADFGFGNAVNLKGSATRSAGACAACCADQRMGGYF